LGEDESVTHWTGRVEDGWGTTWEKAAEHEIGEAIGLSETLLPYSHHFGMVFHMKTTLVINDTIMKRVKAEAARQGRTISELVESALRQLLESPRPKRLDLPPLPSHNLDGALVDIADRDALYQAMEGR
jgi:hypothetical protein